MYLQVPVLLFLGLLPFRKYQVLAKFTFTTSNFTTFLDTVSELALYETFPTSVEGVVFSTDTGTNIRTYTHTLERGTQAFQALQKYKTVEYTITGPTTWITTATLDKSNPYEVLAAGVDIRDPHCTQTANISSSDHYLTYAVFHTILTDQQTTTNLVPAEVVPADGSAHLTPHTFTGPSTVYITITSELLPFPTATNELENVIHNPGAVCGGHCGSCYLYFPTVYVYYWPVASPNTACLRATDTSSADNPINSTMIQSRGLSTTATNASILISEGFTFVSPSAYIAFPTISAFDRCGILGSVHTSTTLAFAPDELSTIVLPDRDGSTHSFDFADALCQPSSLSGPLRVSVIGQKGYNPVISPPKQLTLIDPAWNANCRAACFQGKDPPIALRPVLNLLPSTTSTDPIIITTSAIPVQTQGVTVATATLGPQTQQLSFTTGLQATADPQKSEFVGFFAKDPSSSTHSASRQSAGEQSRNTVNLGLKASSKGLEAAAVVSAAELLDNAGRNTEEAESLTVLQMLATAETDAHMLIADLSSHSGQFIAINSASTLVALSQILTSGLPVSRSNNAYTSTNTLDPRIFDTLTFGGQVYTANPSLDFIIAGQTLTPGGAITVSGTPMSLATTPTNVVIGTSTQCMRALSLSGPNGASSPVAVFEGGVSRVARNILWMCLVGLFWAVLMIA